MRPLVPVAALTGSALEMPRAAAEQLAADDVALAGALAGQVRVALDAAGAADARGQAALAGLVVPPVGPPARPVAVGLTGGGWGPLALPSCPTTGPAEPEPDDHGFWGGLGHGILDVVGLVPVLGEPADGVNAIWYGAEGDTLNAGLSAAGIIPFLGWGATGAKVGIKGAKAVEEGVAAAELAATATKRAEDAGAAAKLAEAARSAAARDSWGDPKTLKKHFGDHGCDFGAATADDYAALANAFLQRARTRGLAMKIDEYGITRVFDPISNTFASHDRNGLTKTFLKPTSPSFWDRQPGVPR